MKPFILFAGSAYYPSGGWRDYKGGFDSFEEAIKEVTLINCDWWHIVDTSTKSVKDEGWKKRNYLKPY